MSLSSALDVSRSSLATVSELTQLASRNISNASNPGATRKIAGVVTDTGGGARVASIGRNVTAAMQERASGASSEAARLEAIVAALERLDATGGGASDAASPATRIAGLQSALQAFSANPSSIADARSVLSAASDAAATLREWGRSVEDVRRQADTDLRAGVVRVNETLGKIGALNARIVNGTIGGRDMTDDLDARDALIASLSQDIGLTVVRRQDNAIALYTDSGLTLFDGVPREVAIQPRTLVDGQPGAGILIDSVPASGVGAVMSVASGRLAGLIEVRDVVAVTAGAQLDDLAAGLIAAFAESDQGAAPTLPDRPGLFTAAGLTAVPAAGGWIPGLAKALEVNASVDPARGGELMRLRDGGISDPGNPAYLYNTSAESGFAGRVDQLIGKLEERVPHAAATELPQASSLASFSATAVGWLQGQRQSSAQESQHAQALLQRAQDALTRESGVNIDDEMTQLLELERLYQASSKLISTVDAMFGALMQAVG